MIRYEARHTLERGAAADLWRHTLSQVPSVFGRMVYLCSLRDPNTGAYQHYGLAQSFGEEEADRVLRESHRQSFADWLCFNLEQQKADLDLYLSGLDGNRRVILDTWIRLGVWTVIGLIIYAGYSASHAKPPRWTLGQVPAE